MAETLPEEQKPSKKALRRQHKANRKKEQLLEVVGYCRNCEQSLALDQTYCASCGAKRIYNRLTFKNLIADFVDRFLNVEAQFPKTFWALFTKPEDVINGYINGVRKKYISAFGYFAIALTLAGFYAFVLRKWFLEQLVAAQNYGQGITTSDIPSELAEAQMEFNRAITEALMEYNSLNYFITVPVIIIISRLVFWNYKNYNLAEHSVIHLYAFSQFSICSMIIQLATVWMDNAFIIITFLVTILMFIYMGYVLKRVFAMDWGSFVLKTGLFILVLGLMSLVVLLIGGIVGIIIAKTGALEGTAFMELVKQQAEAQKALQEAARAAKDSISTDTVRGVIDVVKDSIK